MNGARITLKRWYLRVTNALMLIGAGAVFLMMVYGFLDVAGRYLANHPMPATYEISKTLMVFVVFLGFSYIQVRKGHMRTEFVTKHLGVRGKAVIDLCSYIIGLVLFALITREACYWSWQSWLIGDYTEGIYRIPFLPARSAVAIGSFFLCVQFIIDIVDCIHEIFRPRLGREDQ